MDGLYKNFFKERKQSSSVEFNDERWKSELSRFQLFVIDRTVGEFNESLGYNRSDFSPDEVEEFNHTFYSILSVRPELNRLRERSPCFATELKSSSTTAASKLNRLFDTSKDYIEALASRYGTAEIMNWNLDVDLPTARALEGQLISAGIRILPFPFNAAVTITSDTDRSNAASFTAYTDLFNRQHGLDFGDSMWLQTNRNNDHAGSGFYTSDLRLEIHP